MDDRKKMKINVEIAGKLYRLTISAEEEERVRRAAAQIKRQIDALKRAYDASLIEYLAMAAMRISIENEENKERLERGPEAFKLKALVSQLDEWVEASSAGGRSDAMGAEGGDSAAGDWRWGECGDHREAEGQARKTSEKTSVRGWWREGEGEFFLRGGEFLQGALGGDNVLSGMKGGRRQQRKPKLAEPPEALKCPAHTPKNETDACPHGFLFALRYSTLTTWSSKLSGRRTGLAPLALTRDAAGSRTPNAASSRRGGTLEVPNPEAAPSMI